MSIQKSKKETRYVEVTKIMEGLVREAQNNNFTLKSSFSEDLIKLFSTKAWGFREITLVITIARLLDSDFKASEAFYECNPRALYEQPIRDVLTKYNIPNRKSGPLNVAKATVGINEEWAGQRRPADVAQSVVNLVNWIESTSKKELKNFAISLMAKFLNEAKRIESLDVEIDPKSDPFFIYNACYKLINETPDAGNTPQRIFGLLLHSYHKELETGIIVTGYEDRASTTSTTSKKPGDVNEESDTGEILKVYEVTLKPFNKQRINESYDTLKVYEEINDYAVNEVHVVCRKNDCPNEMEKTDLQGVLGKYVYQDKVYYFIDIFEWLMLQLIKMPSKSRIVFYELLNDYIKNPNTAEDVKRLWNDINT